MSLSGSSDSRNSIWATITLASSSKISVPSRMIRLQQAAVDVVRPLAAVGLLDDVGDGRHRSELLAFILRGGLQEFNRLFLADALLQGLLLLGLLEGLADLMEGRSALGRILVNARVEFLGVDGESLLLRHRLEEE